MEIQTKEKDWPPGTAGCRAGWVGCQPWQGHLQGAQSFQLEWGARMKSHGASIFSRSCSGSAVGPLGAGVSAQGVAVCPGQRRGADSKA